MQVFYVTPALHFWFIVVSSVFQLFSSLDSFSAIPRMPTKFHHHLQAWLHSMLISPGSRCLPPLLWRCYTRWVPPKIPPQVSSKSLLDDLLPSSAPTAYPIILHPFAHDWDMLDKHSSLLVHLVVVSRGRKQAPASVKF